MPDPSGEPGKGRTGGKIDFEFAGTQSEVNTAQRLADGSTTLTKAGDEPPILVVDAKGEPDRGTEFRIYLPAAQPTTASSRPLAAVGAERM